MLNSFREALGYYERQGNLTRIKEEVEREFEIGAILELFERRSVILCEKIKGYDIPVAGNLLYSRDQMAEGLGVSVKDLQQKLVNAITNGIKPKFINGTAPCHEVIVENPNILDHLPVPRFFERETGPYITAGLIIAKSPVTGRRNVSIARCKVLQENKLMIGIAPNHHLSKLLEESLSLGKPLEVAVAIGNCPAMILASNFYVNYGHDEFDIAGALLGKPIEVAKCVNVDLEVPAEAEIVIEGRIVNEYVDEGPVSEFPGMYVNYGKGVIMKVSCITHRRDAIYQAIMPGYNAEHLLIGGETIATTLFHNIKQVVPNIMGVHVPLSGAGRLQAVACLKDPKPGDGHRAMFAAFSHCSIIKHFVVVNDDIDIRNYEQVLWAIATRMRGNEDIIIIPGVRSDRAEPLEAGGTVTKIGVMAVKQKHGSREDFNKCMVPQRVMNNIEKNLVNYLKC